MEVVQNDPCCKHDEEDFIDQVLMKDYTETNDFLHLHFYFLVKRYLSKVVKVRMLDMDVY